MDVRVIGNSTTVNAGPYQAIHNEIPSVTFTGSASSVNGTITSHVWTKISGPAVTLTNSSTLALLVSGYQIGDYVFRSTATDNCGVETYDEVSLQVDAVNDYNYIIETDVLVKNISESQINSLTASQRSVKTTYFDGLGGPMQVALLAVNAKY